MTNDAQSIEKWPNDEGMTHSRLSAACLAAVVACSVAWVGVPADARGQGLSTSAATSMRTWRRTSHGVSSNAALARYRIENLNARAQQSRARRHPAGWPGATLYSTPYYAITTSRTIPARPAAYRASSNPHYFPAGNGLQTQKPFADIRRPPNAIERYWPYMLEAREDPSTGLIIWRLP